MLVDLGILDQVMKNAVIIKERVADLTLFADSVRRVARGGTALDADVVQSMLGHRRAHGALDELTPRDREVLALMAEGLTNSAIAPLAENHPCCDIRITPSRQRLTGDPGDHVRKSQGVAGKSSYG